MSPTTYVSVEKYRKLSPNYHQIPTISVFLRTIFFWQHPPFSSSHKICLPVQQHQETTLQDTSPYHHGETDDVIDHVMWELYCGIYFDQDVISQGLHRSHSDRTHIHNYQAPHWKYSNITESCHLWSFQCTGLHRSSVEQIKWVFDDNWRIIFISSP